MAWAPVAAAAFAAGTASSMSRGLLQRTCSAAGAATGMAQGLWRSLSLRTDAAPTASVGLAAVLEPPPVPAPRQLLNVVLVGEPGAGKSSLARAFAGDACVAGVGAGGADLLVMESASPPATVCLWQGGTAELDPRFYALADAFMVLYDPSAGTQASVAALEHWTGRCMDGQATTPPPLVVVASWRPAGDTLAQQAAVTAAERWCAASGSIPHCLVSGVADRDGARRAFEEALAEAQARREDGAAGSGAGELATAEAGSVGAAPAGPRQLLRMNSSMNPLYRFRRSSECLPPVEEEAGGEAALGASAEP